MRRTGFAVGFAVAGLLALGGSAPAAAQGCGLTLRVGLGIPLNDLPPENVSFRELGPGAGGGVGLTCDTERRSYGGTFLIQSFDWITGVYLLGDFGKRWPLGDQPGAPWMRVAGVGGLVVAEAFGSQPAILITGPNVRLPTVGVSLGGSARLGFPAGDGALFVDGTLLATFLAAEDIGGGGRPNEGIGPRGFAAPLLSIGYQFTP